MLGINNSCCEIGEILDCASHDAHKRRRITKSSDANLGSYGGTKTVYLLGTLAWHIKVATTTSLKFRSEISWGTPAIRKHTSLY